MTQGDEPRRGKNVQRRMFLKTTGTLAVSSAFAGCSGSSNDSGSSDEGNSDGGDGATTTEAQTTFENKAGVEVGADFETVKELAKEEDSLTFYATQDREPVQTWFKGFNEEYPDVDTEHVTGGSGKLMSRWNSEYETDNVKADIYSAMGRDTPSIWKNGQAMELSADFMPAYGEIPDEFKSNDDFWVTLRLHMGSVVFNTSEVSQDAVNSYMDIVEDDRWSDKKIGWDPTPNLYYMTWFYDNFGREFFTKLADQRPQFVDSHTDLVRLGGAGEFPINFTYTFNIAKFPPDYPVDYFRKGIDELPGVKAPILINNKAPNPNSALLFVNWLSTKAGQQTVGETAYLPWHPEASFAGWKKPWDLYPSDDYEISFMDPDQDLDTAQQVFKEELGDLLGG